MPDAGDFERDMHARASRPGWGDALAALPQDAPDAGAWQRVEARLPASTASAPRMRARWPLWLATAASLVLAVAIPLRMLPQATSAGPALTSPAAPAVPASVPMSTSPPAARATESERVATPVAARDTPRRAERTTPSQRPIRTAATPATRLASQAQDASTSLEPLYAQSAQLEGLLAMARDERVSSGTTAALSGELDARVAAIDTALIQPGLADAQRADLWRRRVDALQQLLGIEATNRLYAARGETYDAALVSID